MGILFTICFELSLISLFVFSILYSENVKLHYKEYEFEYKKIILINVLTSIILFIIRAIIIPFGTNNIFRSFAELFMYACIVLVFIVLVAIYKFIRECIERKKINKGYLFLSMASIIVLTFCVCTGATLYSMSHRHKNHVRAEYNETVTPEKETYLKQLSTTNNDGIVDKNNRITFVYNTDEGSTINADTNNSKTEITRLNDSKYKITFTLKNKNSDDIEIHSTKSKQMDGTDEVHIYNKAGYY